MFSRYDMHADTWSMYYYKDVPVLKNKLGIKDYDLLKEAEDEITYRKTLGFNISLTLVSLSLCLRGYFFCGNICYNRMYVRKERVK